MIEYNIIELDNKRYNSIVQYTIGLDNKGQDSTYYKIGLDTKDMIGLGYI